MTRFFLDTSILVSSNALVRKQSNLTRYCQTHSPVTNEYCLKELRRILQNNFNLPSHEAEEVITSIRRLCTVLPTPSANACAKIEIQDHSDRPIVASAMQANATLVTLDRKLAQQAKRYVQTILPKQ